MKPELAKVLDTINQNIDSLDKHIEGSFKSLVSESERSINYSDTSYVQAVIDRIKKMRQEKEFNLEMRKTITQIITNSESYKNDIVESIGILQDYIGRLGELKDEISKL